MHFKELRIQKTPNGFLPRLPLNGKWLEEIGFTVGRCVGITFDNSCLTLTADDGFDLTVESRQVRKRPRTTLTVHAFHLKKYGFNIGDRVGLVIMQGTIQISKVSGTDLKEF